jgi:hypothetical protein
VDKDSINCQYYQANHFNHKNMQGGVRIIILDQELVGWLELQAIKKNWNLMFFGPKTVEIASIKLYNIASG